MFYSGAFKGSYSQKSLNLHREMKFKKKIIRYKIR